MGHTEIKHQLTNYIFATGALCTTLGIVSGLRKNTQNKIFAD